MTRFAWFHAALVCLAVAGCGDSSDGDIGYMEDDFPSGHCRETGCTGTSSGSGDMVSTGGSQSEPQNACSVTSDCTGGVCVAPVTDVRGPFECRSACVETLDEAAWCADAAACCDPQAWCSARGYCVVPEGASTGSASSTSGGGTSGASTGGGATGASSDDAGTTSA